MKGPIFINSDCEWEYVFDGFQRKMIGFNDQLMTVKVRIEKGTVIEMHSHPHIQSSYVVSGRFELRIDSEVREISAGDGFFAGSNVPHAVKALETGEIIDTFTPMREDFLKHK